MESNHNKDFDNQVKKKFDGFLPEAPSSIWQEVEKGITKESTFEPKNQNISKRGNVKRYMSIAAALVFIGFTIWKLQPEEKILLKGSSLVQKTDQQRIDTIQKVARIEPVKTYPIPSDNVNKAEYGLEKPINETSARPASIVSIKKEKIDPIAVNLPVDFGIEGNEDLPQEEVRITLSTPDKSESTKLSSLEEPILSINNEESYIPNPQPKEKQKIVSSVLNFVANNLIKGEQFIEFTETEHGILKVDLKGIFAKNNDFFKKR